MPDLKFDGRPNDTPIGYFTYDVEDDHWSWSEGMYELHGYEPREVQPSTALMLQHKHPDDALRAIAVLESVIDDGKPFSCYHRVVDVQHVVRYVLSVGRGLLGANGRVEQVTGFFVDLTEVTHPESTADGEAALVRLASPNPTVG